MNISGAINVFKQRIIDIHTHMTFFAIAAIAEQPEENLIFWSVREVQISCESERTHHLVGYIAWQYSGRVTSKIVTFDKQKMLVQTGSGRIYHLKGEPGTHPDGQYVWDHWSRYNQADGEVDVTEQYFDFRS